jgi:uncharacterized repeat protein (TIGR03806 family)
LLPDSHKFFYFSGQNYTFELFPYLLSSLQGKMNRYSTMKYVFILFSAVLGGAFTQAHWATPPKMALSEYGFFKGALADLQPATGVFPYEVNAPLFSDYAEKARFIYLPEGQAMRYDSLREFELPVGAAIIKNFYYHRDARHPEQGRRIIETRLLLREAKGWKALEYIWNEGQTEANLDVAGTTTPVEFVHSNGKKVSFEYVAPNVNQCKGCHSNEGALVPIGITARQLNRTVAGQQQLLQWQEASQLVLPEGFSPETAPRLTDYRLISPTEANAEQLNLAARSYLEANCAHCHASTGPASTSGLFLPAKELSPQRIGINKPPVAAGRGSGHLKYGITPGKPSESILFYRMESRDPGVRMPELGRELLHEEGLALIRAWIKNLE